MPVQNINANYFNKLRELTTDEHYGRNDKCNHFLFCLSECLVKCNVNIRQLLQPVSWHVFPVSPETEFQLEKADY